MSIFPAHQSSADERLFVLTGKEAMNTQDILARLKENEAALRTRGVVHAALFGSRARGDNRPNIDIDIMIENRS